ncbi:MAG: hypothetical protein ABJA94_12065 [Rhodoglobus sp.]
MRKTITTIIALSLALTITPAIAGCSMISGIVSQQTGGDVNLGGKSVPADFPKAVPLITGDIVNGSSIKGSDGNEVWNVLIKVSDAKAFDTIKGQLEDAGFTSAEGVGGSTDGGSVGTFSNDTYQIVLTVGKSGSDTIANYTVAAIKK